MKQRFVGDLSVEEAIPDITAGMRDRQKPEFEPIHWNIWAERRREERFIRYRWPAQSAVRFRRELVATQPSSSGRAEIERLHKRSYVNGAVILYLWEWEATKRRKARVDEGTNKERSELDFIPMNVFHELLCEIGVNREFGCLLVAKAGIWVRAYGVGNRAG